MLEYVQSLPNFSGLLFQLAQVTADPTIVAGGDISVFSGPQFLVALISGLMMTFGFQLLLTNLSVAFISFPRRGSNSDEDSDGLGSALRSIETKVGLWVLVTVSIALFFACFLAVKLSLVASTAWLKSI